MMRSTLERVTFVHAFSLKGLDSIQPPGIYEVEIDDELLITNDKLENVIAMDELLERLAQIDPRQSRIVELRFFAGLSVEETAEVIGISPKTVKNDWRSARAWLHRELDAKIE